MTMASRERGHSCYWSKWCVVLKIGWLFCFHVECPVVDCVKCSVCQRRLVKWSKNRLKVSWVVKMRIFCLVPHLNAIVANIDVLNINFLFFCLQVSFYGLNKNTIWTYLTMNLYKEVLVIKATFHKQNSQTTTLIYSTIRRNSVWHRFWSNSLQTCILGFFFFLN